MDFNMLPELTTENIAFVVFAILAVIVAIFLLKRVASCVIRLVLFVIALAVMAYIYLNYIQVDTAEEASTVVESVE